jgi:rubrerythrin
MGITFNASEVFEMAEEIERNAATFYRQAAEKASNDEIKKMLLDMAVMEDGHLETFETMRKQLSEREKEENVFDPNDEAVMYLQTMADARSWEGRKSPDEKLSGNETMKEIIEIALNSEKESVVFYHGLRSLVPPKAGRDKIDAIINEELSHIRILLEQLKQLN